ncbi:MAG: DUF2163 domain-containing protein [Gammaproteobacteria bacterium]|nr:DUF2163 domain-containing protein [Gammaproteobacteria bacterium]
MTYSEYEEGPEGYPVELYKFDRGISESYFLTSSDTEIIYLSNTYKPIQIERGKIEVGPEMGRANITIKIQRNADILDNFVQYPPTEIMNLTILRFHQNDSSGDMVVVFQGRVTSCEWVASFAKLECEPVFTSLKRPGLRRKYQAQCPHVLYGALCGLDSYVYAVTEGLTGVAGAVITAPTFAVSEDYFLGGYMNYSNREFRTIVADDGAGNLTLARELGELEVGVSVTVFPGCDHSLSTCNTKFGNSLNYGGFPYIPRVNPFGGNPVF